MTTFPARLRRLRVQAGLSVAELATRAGLQRTHLYALERGYRGHAPAYTTLRKLAAALGCTVEQLAG